MVYFLLFDRFAGLTPRFSLINLVAHSFCVVMFSDLRSTVVCSVSHRALDQCLFSVFLTDAQGQFSIFNNILAAYSIFVVRVRDMCCQR